MKTNIGLLLASLMLMAAPLLSAQPKGGHGRDMTPEQRIDMMTQHMKSDLNLTDEQTEAVKKLNTTSFGQGDLRDPEARKEMMTKRDAELKNILTPEQYTKWGELQQQWKTRGPGQQQPQQQPQGEEHGKSKHGKKGGSDPSSISKGTPHAGMIFDRMKEKLALTDQQAEQLKAWEMKNIDRQRQMAEQRRSEFASNQEALKQILTTEQYDKMFMMRRVMMHQWMERSRHHQRPAQGPPCCPGDASGS